MTATRLRADRRQWPIRRTRPRVLVYLGLVVLASVVACVPTLADTTARPRDWGLLALLTVLAIAFEEAVRRAARLQLRLGSDMKRDMTSVWAVGGAVSLRPAFAVVLLSVVLVYIWFRQQRPAGEPLHLKVFNGAVILGSVLAAGALTRLVRSDLHALPWMLEGLVSVVVAIVAYTGVNRGLVTCGALLIGIRGRALLGTREDNLIELATLCLGGLLAVAITYEPWLVVLVIVPMVTLQRGALVRELEVAATTDSKTGLLNAVAWEQVAQRELARARRESGPVSVLIVDLDRFKTVNDRFGHLVGDAVLAGIGRALESTVREYDTVGRFGGEEFVAVLPSADADTAAAVAERMRARINTMRVGQLSTRLGDAGDLLLSVSIGVADAAIGDGVELADLLHAADRALYRAKDGGRNRVCVSGRDDNPKLPVHL